MSSGLFLSGKQGFQGGDIDLINDDISAILVDLSQYTPDRGADTSLADIPEDAIISESLLTGKSLGALEDPPASGDWWSIFRADDTVFNSVASEFEVSAIVIFKKAISYSESTLIYIDEDAAEYPITPDGTDITIQWPTGDSGIFRF